MSVEVQEVPVMREIKRGKHKGKIVLDGEVFSPFLIGKIPSKFGFIYDANEDQDGYYQWFNRKGLTYINVPL